VQREAAGGTRFCIREELCGKVADLPLGRLP
jgi:hypothetical protein